MDRLFQTLGCYFTVCRKIQLELECYEGMSAANNTPAKKGSSVIYFQKKKTSINQIDLMTSDNS